MSKRLEPLIWSSLEPNEIRDRQRAYILLGNDLLKIFEYIEPNEKNANSYGHQGFQLFLRICSEFESACKHAAEHIKDFNKPEHIKDFARLNEQVGNWNRNICCSRTAHNGRLSTYSFFYDGWTDVPPIKPLEFFASPNKNNGVALPLNFYKMYNDVKHNRVSEFPKASLRNILNAYAALTSVLDWQGITVNPYIVSDCNNEVVVGSRFGYFTIGNDSNQANRVYF